MRAFWRESVSHITIVFCVGVSNECTWSSNEKCVYGEWDWGETQARPLSGEDQDPSFWCSAPFDWLKRKLEKTKIDSVAASQLFHLLQ